MEIDRPDRVKAYQITTRVGLLLALSYSVTHTAWNFIEEYFYLKNANTTFYLLLVFLCLIGKLIGAWAAGQLAFKY